MQAVKAGVILEDAARQLGWDYARLSVREKRDLRNAFSRALQEVWEAWWWAELMLCAQHQFAPTYDNTKAVSVGDTVYFPANRTHYTSVRDQAVSPNPTTVPPAFRVANGFQECGAFWVRAQTAAQLQCVEDHAANRTYELGEIVRNPDDGQYYAYVGGITVSGAGTAAADGNYYVDSASVGSTFPNLFYRGPGSNILIFGGVGSDPIGWYLNADSAWRYVSHATSAPQPELATGWQVYGSGAEPVPTFTQSSDFTDATAWGVVTPFEFITPFVNQYTSGQEGVFGPIRSASRNDPRHKRNAAPYPVELNSNGYEITGLCPEQQHPWIWSRRPTPIITADDWDPNALYQAADPTTISYPPTTITNVIIISNIFTWHGDPNGFVTATGPALCIDTLNKIVWQKSSSQTSNNEWT